MMKKNKITITITIILIIVAAILIITNSKSTLRKDISDFTLQDTSIVTKIFMADKNNNQVTLEKTEDGSWKLNNTYKANKKIVESLLKTMQDIEVRSPVSRAAHNSVISRMAAIAVKVEIYQMDYRINLFGIIKLFPHEKLTKTYYVGDATQDNLGTFMLMENSKEPYIIHIPRFRGYVSPRYSPIEDNWRDHTVFDQNISDIKSVTLEFIEDPGWSYNITNIGNDNFTLTGLQENKIIEDYDTLKLLNFLASFDNIKFEALLSNTLEKSYIDSVTSTTPVHIITMVDKSGDTIIVKTFHKKGFLDLFADDGVSLEPFDLDRLYALVNDEKDIVLIQYYVFDKILRPLIYFEKE